MDQYLQFNSNHPLEHKRGLVKTLMHKVDERDKVEEKSHVKQALHMNGYPDWLINSIPLTQPSLESMISVLSNDDSDDDQDTVRDRTTKKPTCKKSPVILPYIKVMSEQIRTVQAI